MSSIMHHRGPDDEGTYFDRDAGVGLAHRRLSIIDLKTGHQPMSDAAKETWIVFNGEIYNFPDLKKELQGKGQSFCTTSDTEVILSIYKTHGEGAFERMNGIFAFAIYDRRNRSVVLVRDHFGVKPLYYYLDGERLIFASEIKAILQDRTVRRELDYDAFNSFLTFRYNPSPQTLFKNIHKLPPGHVLKVMSDGQFQLAPYWNYRPKTDSGIGEAEAIEQYQNLLQECVRRQMISDVPVGLFLSGGIDSAVLGHLMQQESKEPIKTFSIGFPGEGDYNELDDARATARLIGSQHQDLTISRKDYLDFFLQSFQHTEEPIAETTIPALYYVSRLAASHVKVVLAGQGADEPLAGYHRYIGEQYLSKYASLLGMLPLDRLAKLLPRNERLKRAAFASRYTSELERFLAIYTIFTPSMKRQLLNPDVQQIGLSNGLTRLQELHEQTDQLEDSLGRLLYIDTRLSLPDDLLLFGDKMTMANSLEMRVPFVDMELVMFLESLPSRLKLRGRTGKYIHKKAIRRWLPDIIINRKKRGFATPMDQWLQSDLAGFVRSLVNDRDSACTKYFNIPFINSMIDDHGSRRENYQRHIFALLSFELWHRSFFDSGGQTIEEMRSRVESTPGH